MTWFFRWWHRNDETTFSRCLAVHIGRLLSDEDTFMIGISFSLTAVVIVLVGCMIALNRITSALHDIRSSLDRQS